LKKSVQDDETAFEDSGWNLIEEHNYSPHHPQSTADMASITEQLTTVKIKVDDLLRKIDSIEENKKEHLIEANKYTRNNEELQGNLHDPGTVKDVTAPIDEDIHVIKDELSELQAVQDVTNDSVRPSLHAVESSGQWIVGNASKDEPR
jgi:chromosome segregation ATPase